MLWTDLGEIKKLLQLDPDDASEDFTLNLYNAWATDIFTEILGRDVSYQVRTVVYSGTGTQKLNLKHRPVYPLKAPDKANTLPFTALQVIVDTNANFGQAPGAFSGPPLVYGIDYTINIDQEDNGSREAILYRVNDYWPRPMQRQQGSLSAFVGQDLGSIQVTSTAGWTVDTLPPHLRMAADWLITKMAYLFPLGVQLSSESYIDRSIGLNENQKRWLLGTVKPMILFNRNWKW